MTAMAVDRYLAVVHPLRSRRYRTPRHAMVACLATWLSCAVIMLPIWLYADVDAATGNRCQVRPPRSRPHGLCSASYLGSQHDAGRSGAGGRYRSIAGKLRVAR